MNRLSSLTDQELNQNLKTLVSREREILHEILEHIKEVDSRKTYLAQAYPSTYEYLTKELGYSPASAMRRLNAARLLKDIPEVALEIQAGNLNLSQISEIARGIKDKERSTFTKVSLEQKQDLVLSVLNKTTQETQTLVAKNLDIKVVQYEKHRMQQDESIRLEITLSKAQHTKLNRCKDLLAASLFQKGMSDSWAEVIELLADRFLKKVNQESLSIQKTRLNQPDISDAETSGNDEASGGMRKRDRNGVSHEVRNRFSEGIGDGVGHGICAEVSDGVSRGICAEVSLGVSHGISHGVIEAVKSKDNLQQRPPRTISKQLRQQILRRDQHCQYTDKKTGRKCGSTYGLEIDHMQSQWAGGLHEINNLQVLCKAHNIFKYKQEAFLN